jgi:hypothetical protein
MSGYEQLLKINPTDNVMFRKILEPLVTDKSVPGERRVLLIEHLTVVNVANAKFCRDWVNQFAKVEERRAKIAETDPRKSLRTKDQELSSLVEPPLWIWILGEAALDHVDYKSDFINSFILQRICNKIEEQVLKNSGIEPITYDRVKHLAPLWKDDMRAVDAFGVLKSSLRGYINDSNQLVSNDDELRMLFSLMPERYTRYLLTMLSQLVQRDFGLGPGETPIDIIDTDALRFEKVVHDCSDLSHIIFLQLKYLSENHQSNLDPDRFAVMTGRTNLPPRDSNAMIRHLYPEPNSVGGKKQSTVVKANVVAVQANVEKQNVMKPSEEVMEENKRARESYSPEEFGSRKRDQRERLNRSAPANACYNCHNPGHIARNCEYICGRAGCRMKVGSLEPLHTHKDCPRKHNDSNKVNNRRY